MPERLRHRGLIALAGLVLAMLATVAAADPLLDGLATDDPKALAAAVAAIERAPATPELADALFGAARACEERLLDPARALALYERLLREVPGARAAAAAERRAASLRAQIGIGHERQAAELAQLVAAADTLPPDELVRRADALAAADWPGAPDAAMWIADVLRRTGNTAAAQPRYGDIARRWPAYADVARRNGAGNAIEAGDFALARRLVDQLPADTAADALIREDLLTEIANGRRAARRSTTAWLALALSVLGLLASLVEAMLRGGRRRPSLRPPFEVVFLAPVALVLTAIAVAARAVVAPAVLKISLVGIAMTWISGATLDLLRARGRNVRLRAVLHVLACAAAAIAIGYLAIVSGGLVELLGETIEAGPS